MLLRSCLTPLRFYYATESGASANTVLVETLNGALAMLSDFIGAEFRLKKGDNMGILSDPSNITSIEAILSTSVGQTSTERWEAKAAATAGSTTSIEIGLISGSNVVYMQTVSVSTYAAEIGCSKTRRRLHWRSECCSLRFDGWNNEHCHHAHGQQHWHFLLVMTSM